MSSPSSHARISSIGTVALAAFLGGCASTAVRDNLDATNEFAHAEFGAAAAFSHTDAERETTRAEVERRLSEPLSAEDAVWITLNHSPEFQRLLAESAAASAASVQSGRVPNPVISYERLAAGDELEIDRLLTVSLLDVVLWPKRHRLASMQQVQHRLRSAGDVVGNATGARQAWIDAVAANQSLQYAHDVVAAAGAAAELASRMREARNYSQVEYDRERAFHADAVAEERRAEIDARRTREVLVRQLGLSTELADRLRLPDRLPDLPAQPMDAKATEERAFDQRLDVALARAELEFTAASLGLTRITSVVNALEVGAASTSETGAPTRDGYEVEFRLPLFDFGDARRANAEAIYLAALNRAAGVAGEARSHVREAYATYVSTYELARHYRDEVVPIRKSIAEQKLLLYHGMLISVFELLADARVEVNTVRQAIAAQRDFWVADAALRSSLIGRPIEGLSLGLPVVTPGAGTAQPH